MPEPAGAVVVLASFILDLVVRVPRRPYAGESLIATDCAMFVGGKGNNQAIAAARAGAEVLVIGRLGDDVFSPPFDAALAREGIDARWVTRDTEAGTGLAFPVIEPDGQNSIIVAPRANARTSADDVRAAETAFDGARVLLAQFEVGAEAVWAAMERAHARGMRVLLNPAPAPDAEMPLLVEMLHATDVLLPNEREAEALTGIAVADVAGAERAARALLARGCGSVVVTLGSRGALWLAGPEAEAIVLPPFAVEQVDATAAGDAFCGALAAELARGAGMPEALRRARAAGALAVTKLGAEPSLPTRAEVDALLRARP